MPTAYLIPTYPGELPIDHVCSRCHGEIKVHLKRNAETRSVLSDYPNYCPNCGAKLLWEGTSCPLSCAHLTDVRREEAAHRERGGRRAAEMLAADMDNNEPCKSCPMNCHTHPRRKSEIHTCMTCIHSAASAFPSGKVPEGRTGHDPEASSDITCDLPHIPIPQPLTPTSICPCWQKKPRTPKAFPSGKVRTPKAFPSGKMAAHKAR